MKRYLRLLALILAILTVVSAFAACGDGADTTQVDDSTEPSGTKDSGTNAPETDPIESYPPELLEESDPTVLALDFDTELSLADYLASVEGTEMNEKLNGGEIKDGRWYYNETALAIKDDCGIFDLEVYSVEFDMCFNSFVNKDNTSIFTFITDNDGILGGDSNFYQLKMDMDGSIYHFNVKYSKFQLEAGTTYHVRMEVNRDSGMMSIYIDEELLASATYGQKPNVYNCFRFMDGARGADVWFDNFVVKDVNALLNQSSDRLATAIDGAYVRGGTYANEVLPLAGNQGLTGAQYIDIKYSKDLGYYREGFIKFDISKLVPGEVKYAHLVLSFGSVDTNSLFDIYTVDSDWDSTTITYNNAPKGSRVLSNIDMATMIDLAAPIEAALANGETEFSIRIVPTYQNTDGQSRINYFGDSKPYITVYDTKPEKNFFESLTGDDEKDAAIWAWAQQMYDEWYARYQALPAPNEDATVITTDQSQYTKTNYASAQSTNYSTSKKAYKSRPLAAITDLDSYVSSEFKNAKLDKYGGIMIEALKQNATGFFYTTKIDGRWWIIDPLGYPFISIGLSHIDYSLNGSTLQKENALKKYGTYQDWALATTRQVRDELNFNCSFSPRNEVKAIEDGLPYMAHMSVMSNYGALKGLRITGSGSTVFSENNTMPVFDPDFAKYANTFIQGKLTNQNEARIIGYTSDNELPMNEDMLDRSLTVNPSKAANHYTYACAWNWLKNMTGKDNPSKDDVTDELRDLFRGFVWDRYFYVVNTAFRKYDSNHMYMGTRFLTVSKDSEWVYRFSAQYLDCMTINWYSTWEPQSDALYGIARNGDMPFIVTEFYTKAGDSGLGNTSGAGWYVATQTDRADFYETFTIKLLESNNCVGWQLFHYMDNDPNSGTGDASSVDSNKGIYNNNYELYTDFTDRIKIHNANVYNLIDYFANKKGN